MERVAYSLPSEQTTPDILAAEIEAARAWKRHNLSPEDWLVPLPEACMAELVAAVQWLQKHPQPITSLRPETFSLTACAGAMAKVRVTLQQRIGFAVIDRLPVERYSVTENKALFWLLATLIGPVVSQKCDGTMLYDVKDSGKTLGYGVRRSVTNLEQDFHTDGGWLTMPPEYIGLFCLQPAQEGGTSRCVSLLTTHNELRRQHPDLLARLYGSFWWDRQAEHGPDEAKCSWHPVYQYDGHTLTVRYYDDYVRNGYKLAGASLDQTGAEALEAMRTILNEPDNQVEFHVDKGQILCLNNHQFAHARTAFVDAEALDLRRHMVRLWNRSAGTPHLEGQE